jgi:hypothetical protein
MTWAGAEACRIKGHIATMPPLRTAQMTSGNAGFPVVKLVDEPAEAVRTWQDAKWAVVRPAIVEMNTDGNHAGENLVGRLHLPDTGLLRPPHKPSNVAALFNGNHVVLMPKERPVRIRNFVEEDRPNGEGTFAENGRGKLPHARLYGQLFHGRANPQQVSHAVHAPLSPHLLALWQLSDGPTKAFDLVVGKNVLTDEIPVAVKSRRIVRGVELHHAGYHGCGEIGLTLT